MAVNLTYIQWFEHLGSGDVARVGGKNASLGEMIQQLKEKHIRVPEGFAVTAEAYRSFLEEADLTEKIQQHVREWEKERKSLAATGKAIRHLILRAELPRNLQEAIKQGYRELGDRYHKKTVDVAVRSSATAEDLPEASFAGQQESFLNVRGEKDLCEACRKCYASLFTDRAISYRQEQGFDQLQVALSIGVQKMVRADLAGAGVMFTLDMETGFPRVVVINAAWGLGENVVQGTITPDEYAVFKPLLGKPEVVPIIGRTLGTKEHKMIYAKSKGHSTKNVKTSSKERDAFVLTNEEIMRLARWGCEIEAHYQTPMDIEWAKDGETEELFIVQARPETVQSQKKQDSLKTYQLKEKGTVLVKGLSIGNAIATGKACRLKQAKDIDQFEEGAILVTEATDPDWVPIMKRAAGIVTDQGGRTSHAAIVSRELGMPAIVGCGNATSVLKKGRVLTMSCAEGSEGHVYDGALEFEVSDLDLETLLRTRTRVMMNIASPEAAFRWWQLPCEGVGLARMEFIINNLVKIHPMALVHLSKIKDAKTRRTIADLTKHYKEKTEYFVETLGYGIAKIAASQYPNPVIVRMSDFKTNEYANLIGGSDWEPHEENPMLGFRGASRYYSDRYRDGFALECRAVKFVRETIGLTNVIVMIPFCRTPQEADQVLSVMKDHKLVRGEQNLEVYVMAEIPSNIVMAAEFAERFDGFSIGSNDLTQLVLGVDRDSTELAYLFEENHEAVRRMIHDLIKTANEKHKKVGICGQGPSDHPDFSAFLVRAGIDSISLNPDSVIEMKKRIAQEEEVLSR